MNIKTHRKGLVIAVSAGLISLFCHTAFAAPGFGGPQNQQGDQQQNQQGGPQQNQQGDQQGGQGQQQAPDAASILERMDYDGDGVVTVDDFVNHSLERAAKHYERLDSDTDGVVTEDEFIAAKPSRQESDSIDHDALKQCIEDTTGITLNERPTAEEAFAAADADGDGSLTEDEFLDNKAIHAAERFSELDSSADGVISEEEVEADMTERQTIREAHQNCISEQLLLDESSNNI